jgi:hypothetical protein
MFGCHEAEHKCAITEIISEIELAPPLIFARSVMHYGALGLMPSAKRKQNAFVCKTVRDQDFHIRLKSYCPPSLSLHVSLHCYMNPLGIIGDST